jgi:hypothetical protein
MQSQPKTGVPDNSVPANGYGVFRLSRIPIQSEKVLRIHGYKDPAKINPVIRQAAEAMGPRAEDILVPELHYRRLKILALEGAELTVEGDIVFRSDAFRRFLPDAREVVVSVATMGVALDRNVGAYLEESELVEALFLETFGWLGINILTTRFGGFLRELAGNENYDVTCRLAPGYSYKVDGRAVGWALEQQKEIFAVFDGIELPVALNQNCAMLPKISRTGMFGLIPA